MPAVYDQMGNLIYDDSFEPEAEPVIDTGNALTLDYYRQKVVEFQGVLDALSVTGDELQEAGAIAYASGNAEMIQQFETLHANFIDKRGTFLSVAQALQMASNGINAVGVNFPPVQIPFGMGALQVLPLAAAGAAITAAVVLIAWAREFWRAVREFAARWQHISAIEKLPEADRAMALEKLRQLEHNAALAEATVNQSPLSAAANAAKWAAIAALAYFAYRAFTDGRKN